MTRAEQQAKIKAAAKMYYYSNEQKFDDYNKKMVIDEIVPYIKPGRILELGYTNNIWTNALLKKTGNIDIVEYAPNHASRARKDFKASKNVQVFQTLFEDFSPTLKYDTILMSGVIKHIPDDVGFLKKTKSWLKQGDRVIGCTPNSRSFHRRLGSFMNLENRPDVHNKQDIAVFNVHLYDQFKWRDLYQKAGYTVTRLTGVYLKILSTKQMMYLSQRYDVKKINAGLRLLGEDLRDYAWYLVLVAHK